MKNVRSIFTEVPEEINPMWMLAKVMKENMVYNVLIKIEKQAQS